MSRVDAVCMFSDNEISVIKSCLPNIQAGSVPLLIYDSKVQKDILYNSSSRTDIMFVGGSKHAPNVDGCIWFISEILPGVTRLLPDLKFYLIGSNPPDELVSLTAQNNAVKLTGYLSEQELQEVYQKIKIAVVPLRYGAGVKGKVVEAIYNKVPVITTPIGAEGINNDSQIISIFDQADSMARGIYELYSDDKSLQCISDKSEKFITDFFSKDLAREKLSKWIDF